MSKYYCSYDIYSLIPLNMRARVMMRLRKEESDKIDIYAALDVFDIGILNNIDIYCELAKNALINEINLKAANPINNIVSNGSTVVCYIMYHKNDSFFIELTDYENITTKRSEIISEKEIPDNEIKTGIIGIYDNLLGNFECSQAKFTTVIGGTKYGSTLDEYYRGIETLCCELL